MIKKKTYYDIKKVRKSIGDLRLLLNKKPEPVIDGKPAILIIRNLVDGLDCAVDTIECLEFELGMVKAGVIQGGGSNAKN